MKNSNCNKQQGVASLLTAVILLVCITLVALFTSKTVLMDTKITADNARTAQATAAAQAAMDQAVAYAISGTINQFVNGTTSPFTVTTTAIDAAHPDTRVDYESNHPMSITLTSGSQTTSAQFYFDNTPGNRCDCAAGNCFPTTTPPMDKALIVATGFSDDGSATRTISQCVGSFNILNLDPHTGGAGVPAPLVTASAMTAHGNGTLINRFTQSNLWTGDPNYTIAGQTMGTYLRASDTDISDFSLAQLISDVPSSCSALNCVTDSQPASAFTKLGSNSKSGNGADVIVGDNSLSKLTFEDIFSMSLAQVKAMAQSEGKYYTGSVPSNASGVIVISSSANLPATLGDDNNPVIVIAEGNYRASGVTIKGFLYAEGTLDLSGGSLNIIGSVIAKNEATGNGALSVTYRPMGGNQVDNSGKKVGYDLEKFVKKGVVSGSWRDW